MLCAGEAGASATPSPLAALRRLSDGWRLRSAEGDWRRDDLCVLQAAPDSMEATVNFWEQLDEIPGWEIRCNLQPYLFLN